MNYGKYRNLVDEIKLGKILSSTNVVITSLKALKELVKNSSSLDKLIPTYVKIAKDLIAARPASALLLNSIREVTSNLVNIVDKCKSLQEIKENFYISVDNLINNILNVNKTVAKIAAKRVMDEDTIMTSSYSTIVLETLKNVVKDGKRITVYVPESRPRSEGVVLAKELASMGINTVLFVDSATRYMMKDVDKILTSSEAIAANGAVINKVGTSQIALAAHEARVRFFVISPTNKFNPETLLGELVELAKVKLELNLEEKYMRNINAISPLFDVTPPEYVDAIITERGLIAPQAVAIVIREIYGWPPVIPSIEEELRRLRNVVEQRG